MAGCRAGDHVAALQDSGRADAWVEWVTVTALVVGNTRAAWSWQSGSRHSSLEQSAAEDQAKWVNEVIKLLFK